MSLILAESISLGSTFKVVLFFHILNLLNFSSAFRTMENWKRGKIQFKKSFTYIQITFFNPKYSKRRPHCFWCHWNLCFKCFIFYSMILPSLHVLNLLVFTYTAMRNTGNPISRSFWLKLCFGVSVLRGYMSFLIPCEAQPVESAGSVSM